MEQQTATSEVLKVISVRASVFQAMLANATVKFVPLISETCFLRRGEVFRRVAMHNAPQAVHVARYAMQPNRTSLLCACS